jgi:hypothetical protein
MKLITITKILIYPILLYFIFELLSISIFFLIGENSKLDLYSKKRNGNLQYEYYQDIGLVLPNPRIKTVHYTKEYIDIFTTVEILNKGFGLFDDGINKEKKHFAVAIGDSFTKGVGSGDNLKNGWVELTEKKLKNIDIVNLGGLGFAVDDQRYNYDRLKKLIPHDIVIYNFAGGDLFENGLDSSASFYVNNLLDKKKITLNQTQRIIDNLQSFHGYNYALEYLNQDTYRSYSLWFIIKFMQVSKMYKFLPEKIKNKFFTKKMEQDYKNYKSTRMNMVSDKIYGISKKAQNSLKSFYFDKKFFHISQEYTNKKSTEILIENSARKILDFHKDVTKDGKKFLLIIQPCKEDVYSKFILEKLPKEYKVDYSKLRKGLIEKLNNEFPILDLTPFIEDQVLNKKKDVFWNNDTHFRPLGYALITEKISTFLYSNLN